jgi:hypothetical protein
MVLFSPFRPALGSQYSVHITPLFRKGNPSLGEPDEFVCETCPVVSRLREPCYGTLVFSFEDLLLFFVAVVSCAEAKKLNTKG